MVTKVTKDTIDSGAATDGQILTADGSGNAAFEDAAGGGGGAWSSLSANDFVVSSGASVILTGLTPATIRQYALLLKGIDCGADFDLSLRFGTSGAIQQTSDHVYHIENKTVASSAYAALAQSGQNKIKLNAQQVSAGWEGYSAVVFFQIQDAGAPPYFQGLHSYKGNSGNNAGGAMHGAYESANNYTRIELTSTQTMTKGEAQLFSIS